MENKKITLAELLTQGWVKTGASYAHWDILTHKEKDMGMFYDPIKEEPYHEYPLHKV